MKSRIYLIILYIALTSSLSATAKQRDTESMVLEAGHVLDRYNHCEGQLLKAPSNSSARIEILHQYRGFAVVGRQNGGFALVANDDHIEPILGYTTTAAYDSINMPDGLLWWIRMAEQAIQNATDYSRANAYSYNATGVDTVEPLTRTHWGQGEPYNNQCPRKIQSATGNMATGCVATAMAQIMKYWNHPTRGAGDPIFDINYYLYADFADTEYAWDKMLDSYTADSYTTEEANAVAELMMHCGVAVGMQYNDDESGAQNQYIAGALRDHFGYHTNVGYRNRTYHTNAEWMRSIYAELAAGRPILYAGQDSKMSYGHAFIFDGYDDEGLVHVNWGWDGHYDGYFDINLLNSGYMGMAFTDQQSMIIGIGMPDDNIEHSVELGITNDIVLYHGSDQYSYTFQDDNFIIYNLNDYDLKGTLAFVMPTRLSTRVLATIESYPNTDEWGEYTESFRSFTYRSFPDEYTISIPKTLSNGTYYIYPAFREEGRSDWQPLWAGEGVVSYYRVTKQGSDIDIVGIQGQYNTAVTNIYADSHLNSNRTYNLQGQEVNENYRGLVIKNGVLMINKNN